MNPWLLAGVAAFDLVLLTLLYLYFRSLPFVDRRVLLPVAAGLLGFVFHAVLFFEGAILILQLATIAGALGLCALKSYRPQREG